MLTPDELDKLEQAALDQLKLKLGVRARALPKAMKRAGRRLPRDAHRAAGVISSARTQLDHPKLARMVDATSVNTAQDVLLSHLDKIDPKERRKDALLAMLGAQALNVIGVAALVIGLLVWRGLV